MKHSQLCELLIMQNLTWN